MSGWSLFIVTVCVVAFVPWLIIVTFIGMYRARARSIRQSRRDAGVPDNVAPTLVAFFHPYVSGGGGGERVLWKMIQELLILQKENDSIRLKILIYTVDEPRPKYGTDLLEHVRDRFSINLLEDRAMEAESTLTYVHLNEYKHYLQPASRLSLIVESFGTMQLAWRALTLGDRWNLMPDIFVDTTGCAFTFLVANLIFGCKVWAYVHYPTISTDMLQLVFEQRRAAYNHASYIAQSRVATALKLVYYCIFAVLYGLTGSLANVVMVNSTWTYNHIKSLWKWAAWQHQIQIIYPPCQVLSEFQQKQQLSKNISKPRENVILSIGQFRPEKDHVLQIQALAKFLEAHPQWKGRVKLVLIGSCRGESDRKRLEHLKGMADGLQWDTNTIEFVVNQPYCVVQNWLSKASMGIHTMWNEHFGIGIVEMMSAGVIVFAHNSGGPRSDIVSTAESERSGFLASTAEEYSDCINEVLEKLSEEEIQKIRQRAIVSSSRFSDEVFARQVRRMYEINL